MRGRVMDTCVADAVNLLDIIFQYMEMSKWCACGCLPESYRDPSSGDDALNTHCVRPERALLRDAAISGRGHILFLIMSFVHFWGPDSGQR